MMSFQTFAISETNYDESFHKNVLPFLVSGERFEFSGYDGMKLVGVRFIHPESIGTILIVNGWAESYVKYGEVYYDLYQKGYSIYSYDHRGQGLSPHLVASNLQISFIDQFGKYVMDMSELIEKTILPTHPTKLYLLAHSMGGTIAGQYIALNPFIFDKTVLNAPMLQVNTKPYPEPIANLIVTLLRALGKGEKYAPGKHDYNPLESFADNTLTKSEPRFLMSKEMKGLYPAIVMGGPSVGWVKESLTSSHKIRKAFSRIMTPVIILQAGNDQWVKPDGQYIACQNSKSCELIHIPNAEHEMLMERDVIRDTVMDIIVKFFN